MQINVPSFTESEHLGSSNKDAGLDKADILDEYSTEEDLPDELGASKDPVEQSVVEVDGIEELPAELVKSMEEKFKISFNKQKKRAGRY